MGAGILGASLEGEAAKITSMAIHATAVIDSGARLGADVEVGPYAIIGDGVVVGDRCRIGPHACLMGPLEIGEECVIGFSAALGHEPQVKDNAGPWGAARIGRGNVFREFSQVNRSMKPDGATVVGDDGYFMAGSHIAHDCVVGSSVIMCNTATLGGHVEIQDRAFIGGAALFHQFARVGELAMVSGSCGIGSDIPPFCMVAASRPRRLHGLNVVGLRRAGLSSEVRRALKAAYKTLFNSELLLPQRIEAVERGVPEVERLVVFLQETKRGVIGFGGSA